MHFVLGCGLKTNIHRNYVMFDHVRSGFYVVGIQSCGFECRVTLAFEMLLYGKKRNMFVHSVQLVFRCLKYVSPLVLMYKQKAWFDTTAC